MTVIGGTAGDVGECVTQVSAVENGKAVSGSGKTYVTLTEALAEVREGEPRFLGEETFTVTVGTAGIVSDTTHPSTVARNATYHFKLTSASRPVFTGNNANFTVTYAGNSGSDWFFKVTAVGATGASTTFSANDVVVTTATIA